MDLTALNSLLENPVIQRNIRFKLALIKHKKAILSGRPRSIKQLEKRLEEELLRYPKLFTILTMTGQNVDILTRKLSRYVA